MIDHPSATARASGLSPDEAAAAAQPADGRHGAGGTWALALGSVGVVYGDLGTSPLYATREALHAAAGRAAGGTEGALARGDVVGVASLLVWTLALIVSVKYVVLIMRADNRGEGGTLSLVALIQQALGRRPVWLLLLGMLSVGLFMGDAAITPAISVLSAVEGLSLVAPALGRYVIPITLVIIAALFAIQRRGTGAVSTLFGPAMLVWFLVIGALGAWRLAQEPAILAALNPLAGLAYVAGNWAVAFVVLGSVFLAVTGGEALYADMGHFGRRPINLAWMVLVWPALTLSYLGQGGLVLADPEAAENPFFLLAPNWGLVPLVILATMATVIASQAVISGLFSIVNQAVRMGLLPRLEILHTSGTQHGQIYLPAVNVVLAVAVIVLVLGLGTSSALAAAFGIAVSGVMLLTTILASVLFRRVWGWSLPLVAVVVAPLLAVEAVFIAANALKVLDGGWVPMLVAAGALALMGTWVRGTAHAQAQAREGATSTAALAAMLARSERLRDVPGTAVFLTSDPEVAPAALMHNVKHNQVLHARNLVVSVVIATQPAVPDAGRATVTRLSNRFARVDLLFGYMQEPDVPRALALAPLGPKGFDPAATSFFLNRRSFRRAAAHGLPPWQERLFVAMTKAAADATSFYGLPTNRVVEMGQQLTI